MGNDEVNIPQLQTPRKWGEIESIYLIELTQSRGFQLVWVQL